MLLFIFSNVMNLILLAERFEIESVTGKKRTELSEDFISFYEYYHFKMVSSLLTH